MTRLGCRRRRTEAVLVVLVWVPDLLGLSSMETEGIVCRLVTPGRRWCWGVSWRVVAVTGVEGKAIRRRVTRERDVRRASVGRLFVGCGSR